jgi:hypothetical protein
MWSASHKERSLWTNLPAFFVTLLSEFRLRLSQQQSQSFEKNSYPTLDALIDAHGKSQLK